MAVPNSTVMTAAGIFKSRLLKKWPLQEKFKYLRNSEVTSKIEHAVTTYVYTSNGMKISTFWKKIRDEAEVVQCPFKGLFVLILVHFLC